MAGFWSRLFGIEPESVREYDPPAPLLVKTEQRSALPYITPSTWEGWPSDWLDPTWDGHERLSGLVDTAWACLDLNSSVFASLPTYLLRSGDILPPQPWMANPCPDEYASWDEFAKELLWEYQMGEVFVLAVARYFDGSVAQMVVVPSMSVRIEREDGRRVYYIGQWRVPDGDLLHARYKRQTGSDHGVGPMAAAGARLVTAQLITRHASKLVEQGIAPPYHIEHPRGMTQDQANKSLDDWLDGRKARPGAPALLTGGAKMGSVSRPTIREMALVELAQFTESRIAVLNGVPPFLVGLPSGGDSLTYANATMLFDHHERAGIGPKMLALMHALSFWALPRGTVIEVDRDQYTRPDPESRAKYYTALASLPTGPAIDTEQIRTMERLRGDAPTLRRTGGDAS